MKHMHGIREKYPRGGHGVCIAGGLDRVEVEHLALLSSEARQKSKSKGEWK